MSENNRIDMCQIAFFLRWIDIFYKIFISAHNYAESSCFVCPIQRT